MSFEIPTFQPGQRVRVLPGPYELKCPGCGYVPVLEESETIILDYQIIMVYCRKCKRIIAPAKGFWAVRDSSMPEGARAVPWTRLEALE